MFSVDVISTRTGLSDENKKKPWRTQMIEISSLVFCFCWRRRTRTRSEMDHHSRGENIGRKPPDLNRKSTSSWPGSHFSVDRATFFDQNHVSLTSITFFTIRITFLQIESGQRSCGEDYGLLISPPDLWNHLWFWESSQVVYIGRKEGWV